MCVYKPHSAEMTSETLAGYQMVLQGAHSVAANHNNTAQWEWPLLEQCDLSSARIWKSAETISPLID